MHLNRLLFTLVACSTLLLGACSQKDSSTATNQPTKQEVSVDAVAAQAKGFTVGAFMSANTVYVFFDPQCPHCGHLWQASVPLHNKIKFVWVPVAWINASSLPQGAALLTAANPLELMTEHETSLLSGKGGISATAGITPEIEKSIKANTALLNSFGAESVPYVVAKNARTGQTVSRNGAMTTAALAEFVGVDATP
ncbi:thioredoxin fold domain-containing protein [Rhodoferax sp. AJA081-3]|uniref:thioredoxin fold domain-containing protein n=1 Tax=Rhodoferax sp. AJA081-3 TaxID=2752316 RepID=UPI001AE0AACE|nr:thioredoxin fold domain-containing protein [Rhodoferax sp. AJA081-3]QTN28894.1 thioredoxin fold domain-containing protein [Rhodoferax sp. AJA081-3]